jgi:hypothetical protein
MLLTTIYNSSALRYPVVAFTLIASILCGNSWAADEAKAPTPTSRLNDTGITWGGNYPKDINQNCRANFNPEQIKEFENLKQLVPDDPKQGDILSYQDCKSGRDITAYDDRDGAAGFVYHKVGSTGKILNASAKSWDCVLDEITGLLWEVKKGTDKAYGNRGLHDSDDEFTWYNPNVYTNGGLLGDWNKGSNQCAGYKVDQPATYCNSGEFASRVNQQGLCGFKDWRVPTMTELTSLTHYGRSDPAVDINYFPHMLMNGQYYWSGTPSAKSPEAVWALTFQFGQMAALRYTETHPIILVRKWQSTPQAATGGK